MGRLKTREIIRKVLSLDDTPHKIALSFAVGVYISISPFLGFHTILAIVISIVFRLNKVATVAGSWVNNPWTLAPVYYIDLKVGEFLLNEPVDFNLRPFTLEHYINSGKYVFLDIFVGSVVFGTFASVVTYFGIKKIIEKRRGCVPNKG